VRPIEKCTKKFSRFTWSINKDFHEIWHPSMT